MIVVTGALVRLTGSGLGCDSWPGCEEGRFFPAESYHGFIEFGNRVFGAIPITLTFLTWLASRGHGRFVHRMALAAFLLTLLQAPVGLIVIATDLEPVAVVVHFVLALLALAAALVVVLETRVTEPERIGIPEELRLAGYVLLLSCLGLVVTGTFTTAAGPHAGDPDVDRLWMLESAIRVHVVSAGILGQIRGPDMMPVLLNAADRPLFLGSRPTPYDGADGYPLLLEPLR